MYIMTDIVFDSKYIKSCRKSHTCDWCNETILIFTPATKCQGVFDGKFYCNYFHPECIAAGRTIDQDELEGMTCYFKRGTTEEK